MKPPRAPLFLERETYRRRRIMDGARILPVAGFVLILLPVLWTRGGDPGTVTGSPTGTATGTAAEAVYLFALWLVLILVAALLARPLRAAIRRDGASPLAPGQTAPDGDEGP